MELKFVTVRKAVKDSVPCIVQRACVSSNAQFWYWWRKKDSPLHATLTVRHEDGENYVYRLIPLDNGIKHYFDLTLKVYTL